MTSFGILFLLLTAIMLLVVPRRWAPLPLLAGACYMTLGQGIQIGALNLTVIRLLVAVGVARILIRRERPKGGIIGLDRLMVVWALWAVASSGFHEPVKDALIFRFGLVYNVLGIYFPMRCFCESVDDVVGLAKMTAIILIPVAIEMLCEQATGRNLFALFGGVPDAPDMRNGRLRSQGPFAHSILAGTVGAVCAPLMIGIMRGHGRVARAGLAACLLMVVSSASSGPLMSLLLGGCALGLWRWRRFTRQMRIAAVVGYILLDLLMKVPAYYIIGRIDLVGSSSGWHRAALIESSIRHLGEWWLAGTDYTRHWMPTGVSWSVDHTDITNYYLHLGVVGGLPLMLLFIATLWMAFRYVGEALAVRVPVRHEEQFMIWSLGASLFAHAATGVSVSYWDQSYVFLYVCIGMIGSMHTASDSRAAGLLEVGPQTTPESRTTSAVAGA